jgi:hypothetical protein
MSTTADARFQSFEEFWPFYLGEHRDPRSRALHYAGTTMAVGTVAAAALTLNPAWLLLTPVVGYTPAWIGHFVIEKNRPATFKYPVWSLRGDFKMLGMALNGTLAAELARLAPKAATAPVEAVPSTVVASDAAAKTVTSSASHQVNGTATA